MFYTTPTDDGAITVTCNLCYAAVACPDPWATATAITHHHCDPHPANAAVEDFAPELDGNQEPALHLLAGRWVASCPTCGFQLTSARSQARCERRAARRTCPICHEDT